MRYLLDTNICIYGRRKRPEVVAHFARLRDGEAGMSVITYGELAYGCAKSPSPERSFADLQRFIKLIPALPLPPETGEIYGALRHKLQLRGLGIGPNDLWIAAHVIASGLTLVTNNEREFRRVEGLKIENWAK